MYDSEVKPFIKQNPTVLGYKLFPAPQGRVLCNMAVVCRVKIDHA